MSPLDSVEAHHWTLPACVCTCIRADQFPYPVAVPDPHCGRHQEVNP